MDLQSDQKMALSVRTCIRACTVVVHKAIPWLPLCTGCCSVPPWRRTLPSSRIRILVRVWTGMRPRAVHSVTGGKISHHGRPRFCIGTRSQLYFDLWRKRKDSSDDEDDGSGLEDSSCDILTVSVLQGSQVAPELSMSLRIRPRFKRLHTYIRLLILCNAVCPAACMTDKISLHHGCSRSPRNGKCLSRYLCSAGNNDQPHTAAEAHAMRNCPVTRQCPADQSATRILPLRTCTDPANTHGGDERELPVTRPVCGARRPLRCHRPEPFII
jgi:hypothetical protein